MNKAPCVCQQYAMTDDASCPFCHDHGTYPPSRRKLRPMQTQTILTPDGMIHHTAPFRWFPRIQRWLNLRAAGPGARNVRDNEIHALRATPQRSRA